MCDQIKTDSDIIIIIEKKFSNKRYFIWKSWILIKQFFVFFNAKKKSKNLIFILNKNVYFHFVMTFICFTVSRLSRRQFDKIHFDRFLQYLQMYRNIQSILHRKFWSNIRKKKTQWQHFLFDQMSFYRVTTKSKRNGIVFFRGN
jgi:hypothetical protein